MTTIVYGVFVLVSLLEDRFSHGHVNDLDIRSIVKKEFIEYDGRLVLKTRRGGKGGR